MFGEIAGTAGNPSLRLAPIGQKRSVDVCVQIADNRLITNTNDDCRGSKQMRASKIALGLGGAIIALSASSALAQIAGLWVWETPPTNCSSGRGVSFDLVQDGSAVSGTWEEDATKINNGRLSGVMLDDHSALVSICDESGNGSYPACPDFGHEFKYLTVRQGELWVYASRENQINEHAQFVPSVTLEPDTPHRRVLADKRLQATIRKNGGTPDGLFCNEQAWPRYIGDSPSDGRPVTIDIPKAMSAR
jgi:hypothetical protein